MEFTIGQISHLVNGKTEGNDSGIIRSAAKIEEGGEGDISFLANTKYESYIYTTKASAVIVDAKFKPSKPVTTTLIRVNDPYLAFTTLLEEYQKMLASRKSGREQPHFIGEGVTIGANEYIAPFTYIGRNTRIGTNLQLHAGAFIGDDVVIGDNATIHAGVKIYEKTVIGNNCSIFANAVIGGDGFGFAPQADGSYRRIPQLGNVVIEDDVSIGSNTTVDRATMGSTVIRKGVKLDNLVQIAHNVEVGENTVIAAQTGVSGSTKIGAGCVLAGQVGVVGHIILADGTKVGAQSGVSKSVKEKGRSLSGSPATDLKVHLRALSVQRNLPELERRLERIEQMKQGE
jgi:UDP-3-O-[3-hydroxymyristoyl] glucosamine N-acyltransferase